MKKILPAIALLMLMHTLSFAQLTKADFEVMMKETGISLDSIDRVFLANSLIFNSDGTSSRIEMYYDRTPSDGVNTFALAENGFKINFTTNGKNTVAHFYPWENIASVDLFPDYIRFTMKF